MSSSFHWAYSTGFCKRASNGVRKQDGGKGVRAGMFAIPRFQCAIFFLVASDSAARHEVLPEQLRPAQFDFPRLYPLTPCSGCFDRVFCVVRIGVLFEKSIEKLVHWSGINARYAVIRALLLAGLREEVPEALH